VQKEKRVSISNPEQAHKESYYHQHPEHIEYDKEIVMCTAQFIRRQIIVTLNLLPYNTFRSLILSETARGYIYGYISTVLNDDKSIICLHDYRRREVLSSYYTGIFDVEGYICWIKTLDIIDSNEFKKGLTIAAADYYKNKLSDVWGCRNLEKIIF